MAYEYERDEWRKAIDYDAYVPRFAGGIQIVGDKEDALDELRSQRRDTTPSASADDAP